jgi:SAM-dependent methyltransferase
MSGYRLDLPSPWVVRFAPLIAAGGNVLDVACGRGRHARWLEEQGHRVTAIDRDVDALSSSGASEIIVRDLEDEAADADAWPLSGRVFAAVVVTNYLHRPLFPMLIEALEPGGVLLYETFAIGNARFGKPSNPSFLLESGELLARCAGLQVVAYEDGIVRFPSPASIQRICAVKPASTEPGVDGSSENRSVDPSRHAL